MPLQPEGPEWNVAAVGPTKLTYAYKLADQLIARFLPGAVTVFSPGKRYPGEVNPRWVVNVLANRDGRPIAPPVRPGARGRCRPPPARWTSSRSNSPRGWRAAGILACPPATRRNPSHRVAVLPLDHDGKKWISERWKLPTRRRTLALLNAEGPAGLRLPLNQLAPDAIRRALTLEAHGDALHLFLPPLLQAPFRDLLDMHCRRTRRPRRRNVLS